LLRFIPYPCPQDIDCFATISHTLNEIFILSEVNRGAPKFLNQLKLDTFVKK